MNRRESLLSSVEGRLHRVGECGLGHWQVFEPGGTWVCTCRNEATARRVAGLLDAELAGGNVAAREDR